MMIKAKKALKREVLPAKKQKLVARAKQLDQEIRREVGSLDRSMTKLAGMLAKMRAEHLWQYLRGFRKFEDYAQHLGKMSRSKLFNLIAIHGRCNTANDAKKLSEDARGLGPLTGTLGAGSISIGLVDSIVGEGGVEVPEFVATKHELLALGRHWATEIIHLDFKYFHYGCTGSSELRTREYANRRLNTISKVIGEEEVRKGFRQAEQFFSKAVGQRAWKIFMEARRRSRNASRRKCRRRSPATPRKATNERR